MLFLEQDHLLLKIISEDKNLPYKTLAGMDLLFQIQDLLPLIQFYQLISMK